MTKLLLTVLLVVCAGCDNGALFFPNLSHGPVSVEISESLTFGQRMAIYDAIAYINDGVGADVLRVVKGDGNPESGEIGFTGNELADKSLGGLSLSSENDCAIELTRDDFWARRPEYLKTVAAHELLHCLGYGHVDDPTDIMFVSAAGGQEMKPYLLDSILSRVAGEHVEDERGF